MKAFLSRLEVAILLIRVLCLLYSNTSQLGPATLSGPQGQYHPPESFLKLLLCSYACIPPPPLDISPPVQLLLFSLICQPFLLLLSLFFLYAFSLGELIYSYCLCNIYILSHGLSSQPVSSL